MIRYAEEDDIESVVKTYNQAIEAKFQTAFTETQSIEDRTEWFKLHLSSKYPMFVYTEDDAVVGWLSIAPYRSGRAALRYTVEVSYFIQTNFQRKGIGGQLMQHGLDACRQLGYKTALAIILDKNSGSTKLLEKFGFEKWGNLPGVADFDGIECGQVYYGLRLQN